MARAFGRAAVRVRRARFRPGTTSRAAAAGVSVLAAVVLAGCGALPSTEAKPPPADPADSSESTGPADAQTGSASGADSATGAPGADPPTGPQVEEAESRLADTEVAAEESEADYERDEFGSSWIDTDDNGCPTRDDILARDLSDTSVEDDCSVSQGVLEDPYTGDRIEFSDEDPMAVQIDHIVPLSLAWDTGAEEWDEQTRVEFANDPANLLAADGPANMSKGDSGPGEWRPYPAFRCAYAVTYIGAVDEYGLWLSQDDHAALGDLLGTC